MAVFMTTYKTQDQWREARVNRIGGSDASAIIGLNPYKTNIDLWMEKTGQIAPEDISEKPYVKYGTQAEMYLRELFRLDHPQYQVEYVENNMFVNDKYPWAHASLDGWLTETIRIDDSTDVITRKGILEIKTTNILQSMQKEKWNNRIPDNYYVQCLHYLAVTDFDFVILKAQLKTEFEGVTYLQTKHYMFNRDEVHEDITYLMKEEERFWRYVKSGEKPPLVLPEL